MNLLTAVFISLTSFLIGFILGVKDEPPIEKYEFVNSEDEDLKTLQKEYENFLNYDGSVQE